MFKTTIKLPDYQYIPENIDLVDKTFDNRDKAIDHIETQCDILTEWMINDPSCTSKPVFEISTTNDPNTGNYCIIINVNHGDCYSEFKVERFQNEDLKSCCFRY